MDEYFIYDVDYYVSRQPPMHVYVYVYIKMEWKNAARNKKNDRE